MRQEKDLHTIGKCPVCGLGHIIEASGGFFCDNQRLPGGGKCGFIIQKRMHGVDVDASLATQLITEGKTDEIQMVNFNGQPFLAHFVIDKGKVGVRMRYHALNGRCPVCGGRVLKTSKGYACEYSLNKEHLCHFHVTGVIHGRKISDSEMEQLLNGTADVLDGFTTIDGKVFSSVLCVRDSGEVGLDPVITTCPSCGGNILVSPLAYNCSNYKTPDILCNFFLWRNIAGHQVTVEEMRQICEEGRTREPLELFRSNGAVFFQHLALNSTRNKIVKV